MSKHTPGPWARYPSALERYSQVITAKGCMVEICNTFEVHGDSMTYEACAETMANARLIAAAPDLLEALILMVRTHDEPAETLLQEAKEQQWLAKARAAIAKATQ